MKILRPNPDILEEAAYSKVTKRLLPFLFLCYFAAFLDRVNVSFAKLQMLDDLKLSDAVYGIGAGIFFIGYFLFEVPSNVILHRTGARVGIARIMIILGVDIVGNGLGYRIGYVLPPSLLAWSCRGGVLSGDHPVSHILVSVRTARPHHRAFHDCRRYFRRDRQPSFRLDHAKFRWRLWLGRLAMAFSA